MNKRSGTILITSLWILSILSILAMGIGFRVSLEARLAKYNMDGLKALYLAKAGVVKATYRLSKNPTSNGDTIYECGTLFTPDEASDPDKMRSIFSGTLGEGSFSVAYREDAAVYPGVSDEERRININTAPENVLKNLFAYVGEDPTIASDVVQWRSPGPGLDDGYYEALPVSYECKHQKFSAIEELLLVKGINKPIFDKIKNYITVFGNPAKFAVNINTASKTVLSVIIMSSATSASSVDTAITKKSADIYADVIINEFRSGPDGKLGTKDDILTIDAYSVLQPVLGNAKANNLKEKFITKSGYFRIESTGTIGKSKITKKITCIVTKDAKDATGKSKLIFYREE